jgi:5-methylcytosine-specific restriction endonuclease McrA
MKKPSRKTLIKKLDTIFSKYIRLRKAKNEYSQCVTCGKVDHWTKLQAGHFISRKNYATRWDATNVQVQCSGCNVFKYGEQYKFSLWLDKNIGTGTSEKLLLKSQNIVKYTDDQLQQKIGYYKFLVDKLL